MTEKYRADVDGLRAVAVILVVVYHAFPRAMSGGFIGVDVFFVISGYLITGIVLSGINSSSFSIRKFYARRARRILPALATVLLAALAIGWVAMLPLPFHNLGLHAIAGALFFPNLLLLNEVGYFDAAAETKPLLHLWSLGVEEQFYLFWPLLLLGLTKIPKWSTVGLIFVAIVSFLYCCYATRYHPATAFYSPISRLWELAIGGFLATGKFPATKRSDLMSLAGIVLIVAGGFFLKRSNVFPGPAALIPVTGTALVVIFGSRILRQQWIVSIGLISYPLYLWHWPLLTFAALAGFVSVPAKLAVILSSLVLAALTTAFIERPIRFGWLRPSSVAVSLSLMASVLGLSTAVWSDDGVSSRFPEQIRPVLAVMQYNPALGGRVLKCWLELTTSFESYRPECSEGSTLVWGDSHAGRLYAGLAALKQSTSEIAQFTRDSCPPSALEGGEACAASNRAILAKISELKPKRVILFAVWTSYPEYKGLNAENAMSSSLAEMLRQLKTEVGEVILVGAPPLWTPDLPIQVYDFWRSNGQLPDRLPPRTENYQSINMGLARMAAETGVRFVSPFAVLCNEAGCLTHTASSRTELLTWDYGHLTIEGAEFIARLLRIE
ncbi:acyltransferase [Bradyrhizobium rifense]|uniref:Acyltransferase n=1 Tax=Bradyrhizobium rifense TaxID=515499 RepID=A0A5D3K770_9BRAD|nr:acyltransferase family protein [Bradyrhizobium rifense]TYL91744.1 acyltransferase [Bradyrhizobium rifense]